jgi:hypothetical protein
MGAKLMDELTPKPTKKPLAIILLLVTLVIFIGITTAFILSSERSKEPPVINKETEYKVNPAGYGHGEGNPYTRNGSANDPLAKVDFIRYISPSTKQTNFSLSTFNLRIDDKYQFDNVNYNVLKSILVYHRIKYGLNDVSDCSRAGDYEFCRFPMDEFFTYWDTFYPGAKPVRMTTGELETPVPPMLSVPEPFSYQRWYDEITYNISAHPVPQFHRNYPANKCGGREP